MSVMLECDNCKRRTYSRYVRGWVDMPNPDTEPDALGGVEPTLHFCSRKCQGQYLDEHGVEGELTELKGGEAKRRTINVLVRNDQ